jgi:predicted metal-dependent hydrolase
VTEHQLTLDDALVMEAFDVEVTEVDLAVIDDADGFDDLDGDDGDDGDDGVIEDLDDLDGDDLDDDEEFDGGFEPAPGPTVADTEIEVRVTRSARRKTTVGAKFVGGAVQLSVPSWMSVADELKWIDHFRAKAREMHASDQFDLTTRARNLSKRHDLPQPRSITFVDNMGSRWGSCTPSTGMIRISRSLAKAPAWVLDYVVVHELAHLVHGDHGPEFWALVHRYQRAERAIGFLHGWGLREESSDGIEPLGSSSDDVPMPEDVGVPRPVPSARSARPGVKARKKPARRRTRR